MIETSLLKRCALLVWLALLYELGSSTEAKETMRFCSFMAMSQLL
jgi:hypothetical protein